MSVFDELKARGLIAQMTHEDEIRSLLENEKVTFYIGFDPTADSLHVGHFLQMVVMAHMQKAGHRPIAVIGDGTVMIGDPTGKTDMRRMMGREEIEANAEKFKVQLSKFIDFSDGKALMVNNGDWLLPLNYIEFLREVGVHFTVNRMLTAECYKSRLERSLTFIEFNYMLMQSYDFLKLYRDHGCKLELGGDDQWSNIIGGVELIRRTEGASAYGMTFTLLTTSEGKKMGKTEKGALWLDPEKTSPYEFYQYFRNIGDQDVIKCLKLLTFLPLEEIDELAKLEGKDINIAKKKLAYEVTKMIHGEEETIKAQEAAEALFEKGGHSDNMPTVELPKDALDGNLAILDLLTQTGIMPSKSEGRRLIQQGGLSLNEEKVTAINRSISADDFAEGYAVVKCGKKKFFRINLV